MVITVQCPECSAYFPVDPAKIPQGGVRVRCSVCAATFRVEELGEVAPPPAPAPPVAPVAPVAPPRPEAEVEPPGAAQGPESVDDWVFETEEAVDPGSLDIEPVGTVEDTVNQARDESSFFARDKSVETNDMGAGAAVEEPLPPPAPPVEPGAPETAPGEAGQTPPATGFTFGKRDPHDKARRLARVLVSDIVTYNPERHQRALEGGTLKQDFEEEIEKSWKEYVEQVGEEIAGSTPYWTEALNDVLAQGRQVF